MGRKGQFVCHRDRERARGQNRDVICPRESNLCVCSCNNVRRVARRGKQHVSSRAISSSTCPLRLLGAQAKFYSMCRLREGLTVVPYKAEKREAYFGRTPPRVSNSHGKRSFPRFPSLKILLCVLFFSFFCFPLLFSLYTVSVRFAVPRGFLSEET